MPSLVFFVVLRLHSTARIWCFVLPLPVVVLAWLVIRVRGYARPASPMSAWSPCVGFLWDPLCRSLVRHPSSLGEKVVALCDAGDNLSVAQVWPADAVGARYLHGGALLPCP